MHRLCTNDSAPTGDAATPLHGQNTAATPNRQSDHPAGQQCSHERTRHHLEGRLPPKNGVAAQGCVSSLTRQQFEELTALCSPRTKGRCRRKSAASFATQYAKLLTLSDAARELGLENDPKVQQIFTFARNQILAEALNQHYVSGVFASDGPADSGLLRPEQEEVRRSHSAAHHHSYAAGSAREAEA